MRTLTTAQRAVYEAAGGYATHPRAFISNDNGSTWLSLRELAGRDFFLGATWEETIDQGVTEARVIVSREQGRLSLAPDMTLSALNNLGGTYSPLLRRGHSRIRIQAAVVARGEEPQEGQYLTVWEGYLCGISDSGEGGLELFCRDNSWPLLRTFIKQERVYGADAGVDVEQVMAEIFSDNYLAPGYSRWVASTHFDDGSLALPTPGHASGFFYVVGSFPNGTATTGTTEPTWPSGEGSSVADNTAVWYRQDLYLLDTPTTPSWAIGRYLQQMDNIFKAAETLALQIGWALRQRWDEGSSSFRLTLYSPDRDKTSPDYTLKDYQRRAVPSWGGDIDELRNVVQVTFQDKTDLDAAGQPKQKTYVAQDAASIAEYGEMWMNYTPAAAANIDTPTEAARLGDVALADLSQPPVEAEVETGFLHFVQLGDLLRLPADGAHHDTDYDGSVTKVSHKLTDMKASTTVSLRGQPMVARTQWLIRAAARGNAQLANSLGPLAVSNLTVSPTAGGVAVSFEPPIRGPVPDEYELHLSSSSGFTPDDTTFYAKSRTTTFNVTDLDPGATLYAKVVPREKVSSMRGTTSSEVPLTTRYVEPRTLQPQVTYAALPLNSDFEAYNDPARPPDGWEMANGSWGTDASIDETKKTSGGRAVRLEDSTVATGIRSAAFVCAQGDLVRCSAAIAVDGALDANDAILYLRWLDSGLSEISTTTIATTASTGLSNFFTAGYGETAVAPVGTCYAQLGIAKASSDPYKVWVDACRVNIEPGLSVTSAEFAYQNSFVDAAPSGSSGYLLDGEGFVIFEGAVSVSPTPSSGTTIAVLPSGVRPLQPRTFPVVSDGGAFGSVSVQTDGRVVYVSGTTTTRLWLDGIRFRSLLT